MKRAFRISILTLCLLGIAQPCPYFMANALRLSSCGTMGLLTPCGKEMNQCAKRTNDRQSPGHPGSRDLTLLHCVPEDFSSKAPQPMVPVRLAIDIATSPLAAATIHWEDPAVPIPLGREILNLNLRI